MSDKAARFLMYGMVAIALAIVLARDIYVVESTHRGMGVLVINQWTGNKWLCVEDECEPLEDITRHAQ